MSESKIPGAGPKLVLVHTASQLLSKHGLEPLPFDLVAAQAGTSRQTIRRFYPDPNDISIELATKMAYWYDSFLIQELKRMPKVEQLDQLLNFYLGLPSRFSRSKPNDDVVANSLLALSTQSRGVKDKLLEHYEKIQNRFSKAIKASEPSIKPKECQRLAYQIVCLLYGHWNMLEAIGFSEEYRQVSRQAARRLIKANVLAARQSNNSTV